MPSDLCFKPAHELASRIRSKQLSPVELMQACLDRIEQTHPTLNAFIARRPRDELLADANGNFHGASPFRSGRCRRVLE